VLDYILGTLHLPRGRKPTKYWLDQPIPQTYGAQLLYPFAELPRRRLPSGREAYPLPSCCGRFRRLENDVAVPRVVPTRNQLKYIDCQTALHDIFDPQRLFGELSNHSASFEPCPPTAYHRHNKRSLA
jgi:hypothetical protein